MARVNRREDLEEAERRRTSLRLATDEQIASALRVSVWRELEHFSTNELRAELENRGLRYGASGK